MTDARESPPPRVDGRALTLIALLALAAAGPSLLNGFAYDDYWIIVTNNRVHTLARWADWFTTSYWPTRELSLYRPLTTAAFAVQWVVGHGTPLVFHVINVALSVAGAVAFTWVASMMLPAAAAIVAGALFAVHPTHVEAVGNVVGQSELSAGLVIFVATGIYIRARQAGALRPSTVFAVVALYLAGIACKENAIILPAMFAVAEFTILRDGVPWGTRARQLAPTYALLAVVAAGMFAARFHVLKSFGGDVPHPSLDGLNMGGRALVMLGVLPDLVRLIVWPAALYADYSPEQMHVSATLDPTQINGALVAVGAAVLLAVAMRRSRVATFGLLVAGGAWLPTSNLVFPSGILLSERTLYIPTAGVLLAVGACVAWFDARTAPRAAARTVAGAVLGAILILGVGRSADRQRVWRSRDELFWTMHRDEPLSFRAHYAWGSMLFDQGNLAGGEREWRMALRIFPRYHMIYQDLGRAYREHHLCQAAIPMYVRAIELSGGLSANRMGLVACQLELARYHEAKASSLRAIAAGDDTTWFRARVSTADSALAANDSTHK